MFIFGFKFNKNSFWRLPIDVSKISSTKYNYYMKKLKHIAKMLWQYKEKYIKSINNSFV